MAGSPDLSLPTCWGEYGARISLFDVVFSPCLNRLYQLVIEWWKSSWEIWSCYYVCCWWFMCTEDMRHITLSEQWQAPAGAISSCTGVCINFSSHFSQCDDSVLHKLSVTYVWILNSLERSCPQGPPIFIISIFQFLSICTPFCFVSFSFPCSVSICFTYLMKVVSIDSIVVDCL